MRVPAKRPPWGGWCCALSPAKRYNSDLAPYPNTMRVFENCMKLEAFDRAVPEKQPDAE